MSIRGLAGVLLFVLVFGSACLMRVAPAQAGSDEGGVEPGLNYVNGSDFKLINSGHNNYIVVVTRKQGMPNLEPQVSYVTGSVSFSKTGLDNLRIYRLTPVGEMTVGFRPCNGGPFDCPLPRPLPPPPPPTHTVLEFP